MASINDEQNFFKADFLTMKRFKRATFDELAVIVISTSAGVLLNFDQSGRMEQPTRKYIGRTTARVRPRPDPPISGIPSGPPSVLSAEMNMANLQLNDHTTAVNQE
jgi:hypothetical protein